MNQSYKTGEYVVIDPSAIIGDDSIVWHHSRILADVEIGKNVSIGAGSEIGRGSIIGDNSRISAMVFLPPNSQVGKDVFIGPASVFTDDRMPFAGNAHYKAEPPRLLSGCSIGAGCVILPGITIGRKALVGAGSVVTKDVPDGAVVRGEPARLRRSTNFDVYAEPIRDKLMESHLLPT